jgi:regulator of sigma E protease
MTILLFIAVLAVLILSHEFGHFVAAKVSGMRVEEFGFGFPPRLFSKQIGETVYSLNLLPLGGFVKIFGEDDAKSQSGSFSSKPIYLRTLVLTAGVIFNLILAWFLVSFVLWSGAPSAVGPEVAGADILVTEVQTGTPAQQIGLASGDKLLKLSFGDEVLKVSNISDVQNFISRHKGNEIKVEVKRGDKVLEFSVAPSANPSKGKGALGIAMERVAVVREPIQKAIWKGLVFTIVWIKNIIYALVGLLINVFKGGEMGIQLMGPVGIAGIVGVTSKLGLVYLLQLVALLSINLAIINFLPFPALDGGRFIFLMIEAVKRSPVSPKIIQTANNIGFVVLIILMIFVSYYDIVRIL